ncbi:MAG: hypothetical protein K0R65_2671 [Crocinitomicaceae bacterium]|jgi:hypothetical protein|nr:hypothetical protein [Crocinitomicaceae bacterium]
MRKYTFLITIVAAFFMLSCSGDLSDRTAQEYLSAYMKDNKQVVLFGKIDAKQILEKADYKNIPKAAVLLKSEMQQYEAALDLSQGICFALEGPFAKDAAPSKFLAFVKVKSMDSLTSKITSLGLMMEEEGDMKFTQDNDVSIGVKEHLAIFITKKGNYDGKVALKEAFEKTEQDPSEGKIEKILSQKGDILMGVSFQNLYATSNTSLEELPPAKKKQFEALVNDSYIQSRISFEKGQAVFESQNLFSKELMDRMFFQEDPGAAILAKLGKGNARLGVTMNMDMNKMESFVDDFAPDFKRSLSRLSFQMQLIMSSLGDKPLTNLLNGQLGLVMVGDMMRDGSLVPDANIYIGLGNKGKDVSEALAAFLPKDGLYGMHVNVNDKEVYIASGGSDAKELSIPAFAAEFGKKGVTAFINFDGMDMESLGLRNEGKALYAFRHIMVTVDNNGSQMIITGKNPDENILKQVVNVYVKDLEKSIGAIN